MTPMFPPVQRRHFLAGLGVAGLALFTPGVMADELTKTPKMTEGPFYPDKLPLDTDNDLIIINDQLTPAVGQITHLTGKILSANGSPLRNAVVEIWQVDNHGAYIHLGSNNGGKRDKNFQGFGRFVTSSTGEYYFRTIKPVPYPGRTPHIHMMVKVKGQPKFCTQCFIKGEPQNDRDGVLRGIRDPKAKESVIVDFATVPGSKLNEVAARFNVVLGYTPEDKHG
ncbi:MAG: intradiol ring-cleavage dioxygenase [Planctomycetia bacterium]|nr:intradiol ring-cleavage dioxygenase [Planctomycetia bacterium]